MILYNIAAVLSGFFLAKFDEDLNVLATYDLIRTADGKVTCTCPGWPRKRTCKHVRIMNAFVLKDKVGGLDFYCYETQTWHRPMALEVPPEFANGQREPVQVPASPAPSTFRRRI